MNIYEKLIEARKYIKENHMKKVGTNEYSHYDYFTPVLISKLVGDACNEFGLIKLFSLCKDEFGLFGRLTIQDVKDVKEYLTFEMRTEIASMKATNLTQQMGGCDTYTRRYLCMNAFDICDNSLDFDSQDNRPKDPPQPTQVDSKIELDIISCNTLEELERFYKAFNPKEQKLYSKIVTDHKLKLSLNKKS